MALVVAVGCMVIRTLHLRVVRQPQHSILLAACRNLPVSVCHTHSYFDIAELREDRGLVEEQVRLVVHLLQRVVHPVGLADRSQSIPAADSTWPFEHSIR